MKRSIFDFLQQNSPTPESYPLSDLEAELLTQADSSSFLIEVGNHVQAKLENIDSSEASCRKVLTITIALNEFLAYVLRNSKDEDTLRGMLDALRVIWRS